MADEPPTPIRKGADALQAFMRVHELGLDRRRPYVGQPWTLNGERGAQTLPPITLRDLADVIMATLETGKWREWSEEGVASNVCLALQEEFPQDFPWMDEHPYRREDVLAHVPGIGIEPWPEDE